MRAFPQYTRRRLERTDGGVLNLHTEGVLLMPSRTTPHKTTTPHHNTPHHQQKTQHHNTTYTPQHTSHARNHVNTHIHIHLHIHISQTHTTHTRMLGYAHIRHTTVILRRKSECLDVCTAVNHDPTLNKVCNICNVCNFLRIYCFGIYINPWYS